MKRGILGERLMTTWGLKGFEESQSASESTEDIWNYRHFQHGILTFV
jgi:hypothetical protein